jgi:hypothetical protein
VVRYACLILVLVLLCAIAVPVAHADEGVASDDADSKVGDWVKKAWRDFCAAVNETMSAFDGWYWSHRL